MIPFSLFSITSIFSSITDCSNWLFSSTNSSYVHLISSHSVTISLNIHPTIMWSKFGPFENLAFMTFTLLHTHIFLPHVNSLCFISPHLSVSPQFLPFWQPIFHHVWLSTSVTYPRSLCCLLSLIARLGYRCWTRAQPYLQKPSWGRGRASGEGKVSSEHSLLQPMQGAIACKLWRP